MDHPRIFIVNFFYVQWNLLLLVKWMQMCKDCKETNCPYGTGKHAGTSLGGYKHFKYSFQYKYVFVIF